MDVVFAVERVRALLQQHVQPLITTTQPGVFDAEEQQRPSQKQQREISFSLLDLQQLARVLKRSVQEREIALREAQQQLDQQALAFDAAQQAYLRYQHAHTQSQTLRMRSHPLQQLHGPTDSLTTASSTAAAAAAATLPEGTAVPMTDEDGYAAAAATAAVHDPLSHDGVSFEDMKQSIDEERTKRQANLDSLKSSQSEMESKRRLVNQATKRIQELRQKVLDAVKATDRLKQLVQLPTSGSTVQAAAASTIVDMTDGQKASAASPLSELGGADMKLAVCLPDSLYVVYHAALAHNAATRGGGDGSTSGSSNLVAPLVCCILKVAGPVAKVSGTNAYAVAIALPPVNPGGDNSEPAARSSYGMKTVTHVLVFHAEGEDNALVMARLVTLPPSVNIYRKDQRQSDALSEALILKEGYFKSSVGDATNDILVGTYPGDDGSIRPDGVQKEAAFTKVEGGGFDSLLSSVSAIRAARPFFWAQTLCGLSYLPPVGVRDRVQDVVTIADVAQRITERVLDQDSSFI